MSSQDPTNKEKPSFRKSFTAKSIYDLSSIFPPIIPIDTLRDPQIKDREITTECIDQNSNKVKIDETITQTSLDKLHKDNMFNQKDICNEDDEFYLDLELLRKKLQIAYALRYEVGRFLNKISSEVTLEDVAYALELAKKINNSFKF